MNRSKWFNRQWLFCKQKETKKIKQERLKTSNLRSDLSDYSDPDIFLKGK